VIAAVYCFFQGYPETARLGVTEILVFNGSLHSAASADSGHRGGMQVVAAVVLTQVFGLPSRTRPDWRCWYGCLRSYRLCGGIPLALHEGLTFRRIRDIEKKAGL